MGVGVGDGVVGDVGGVVAGSDVVDPGSLGMADFFLYKLNLPPEPQYSPLLPAHVILHCVAAAKTEPTPSVFPHQHSLLLVPG